MNNFSKRFAVPLGILVFGGWSIRILQSILQGEDEKFMVAIVIAMVCFAFGISLNPFRKKKQTWLKKVIVSFVLLFFLLWNLGYLVLPQLKIIMNLLAIEGFIIYLIYVFCGWTFFD